MSGKHGTAILSAWAGKAIDILLPRYCVMCGLVSGAENLCRGCSLDLPRIGHCCRQCGQGLSVIGDGYCGACLSRAPPWDSAIAALAYRFPVDQLVCRFKFGRNLACGQVLARELSLAAREKCENLPGCLLPVPLHRYRHFSRGFNQADVLARQAGKALGIPVLATVLNRKRRTRAQSGLDAASRKRNIRGAFDCKFPQAKKADLAHVALVDDVMTTGATLAECSRMLKKAGVGQVSVWVSAKAAAPGKHRSPG
jgi:ComF family protein